MINAMKIKERYDLEFFWVCLKIGLGILIYRIGLNILSYLSGFVIIITAILFREDASLLNIVSNLSSGAAAVVSFTLGALVIYVGLHIGKHRNYQRIHKRIGFSWFTPLIVVAAVGINYVMAGLNAYIMSFISSYEMVDASTETMTTVVGISLWEIFAMLISTAVIPAICEEIVFRGLILTNLEPYGKGTAILGSAFLFGLMHMNPAQFLYTTVLGLMLGLVYVKTKSIWLCMVIHFANNGIATIIDTVYFICEENVAIKMYTAMTLSVIVLGTVALFILALLHRQKKRSAPAEVGSFGRVFDSEVGYAAHPVTGKRKILLFFSSTIAVFTVMVFVSMAVSMLCSFLGLM